MEGGVMDECEASKDVLLSDTMDQYRTFQMCERLLHSPAKLANQLLFQIPPHRQIMLIERCSHDAIIKLTHLFQRSHNSLFLYLFVKPPPLCYVSSHGNLFFVSLSLFRYYAFDDTFVREVLGKKLSKGTKKDLDDISAKTGVTLKSCRRQVSLHCAL